MAKKIIWTRSSIQDRERIYKFWVENNKDNLYSEKLEQLFYNISKLISEFPNIGIKTDVNNLRIKTLKN